MVNYQNGKIYKIESHQGDKIYIGSTSKQYLSQRFDKHRSNYKKWKIDPSTVNGKTRSYELFDDYGLNNCFITLIESFPCNSKDELTGREAYYIRSLTCVNKVIPLRTEKEYRADNKEIIKEKMKEYRADNNDIIKQKQKEYRADNKEIIKEKQKEYYNDNSDIIKQKKKEYYNDNSDNIKQKKKEYYKTCGSIKSICGCGLSVDKCHKSRHYKTTRHQAYLKTENEALTPDQNEGTQE